MKGMKITTVHLPVRRASPGGGKPPGGRLAAVTGVAVVAIRRGEALISNPGPDESLLVGDRIAILGTPSQVTGAERLFDALAGLEQMSGQVSPGDQM